MRLTVGSLFAGIGGLELGLERAGMEVRWQVEIDDYASRVLAKHWPNVKRYRDVRGVGRHNLEAVDVICGGFPCQDVSVAGRRAGLVGERSGLWYEFHRILGELRPRWVVIENVPGLLSSTGGRDFAIILRGLVECGYCVAWRVLDAQYFGVAQRRRRVFIVGSLGDGRSAEVLFEREGSRGDSAPCRGAREGFAAAITERTRDAGRTLEMQPDIAYALTNPGSGGRTHSRMIAFQSKASAQQSMNPGNVSPSIDAGKGDGICAMYYSHDYNQDRIYGTDGIAPACTSRDSNGARNVFHDATVRRLAPVECCRLQGFPDDWLDGMGLSDSAKYRMLGNAVCVPVAAWIGAQVAASETQPGIEPERRSSPPTHHGPV